jgi:uncharacterized repeat protein (TIGR02543 family)
MKTMNKLFLLAIMAALIGVMVSCSNPAGSGGGKEESDTPASEDDKTYIVFENSSSYAVDVYSDSGRVNKEAAVPAGEELTVKWTPSPDGALFYLSYQMPVGDDVTIPYNPLPIGPYRIDEGKSTPILIVSPASSPDVLTEKVYLLLYNEGNSGAFRLVGQGGEVIRPEKIFDTGGSGVNVSSLVNPHERAWYIVSAASANDYYMSVSGERKPFPASVTEFQVGWFYTFRYADGGLAPVAEQPLSLEWMLSRRVVTFNADGGSPETQTRAVNSGNSLGAENMPGEPAKDGYGFGGWYTEVDGGGNEFTADTTVIENITVYARWTVQYTVTFNADGGSPDNQTRVVNSYDSVGVANMPAEPTKSGFDFFGWYTGQNGEGSMFTADTQVTENLTVYAKWTNPTSISGSSLQVAQ